MRVSKRQVVALWEALTGSTMNPAGVDAGWQRLLKSASRRWGCSAEEAGAHLERAIAEAGTEAAAGEVIERARGYATPAQATPPESETPPQVDEIPEPAPKSSTSPPPAHPPIRSRPIRHREGTKEETVIALLRRPEGADVHELMQATGWQRHTVRGALSGSLTRKRGLRVVGTREGERYVYRIKNETKEG